MVGFAGAVRGQTGAAIAKLARGPDWDIVAAERERLMKRGAKFGKVLDTGAFCMCNGKDPDGNPIQLSGR